MAGATGEITDIIGVVLNAKFPEHGTPEIYNAIEIPLDGGGRLVAEVTKLGDYPRLVDTLGIATSVINGFREGRYDDVFVIYGEFINTLVQRPALKRLLPVEAPNEPDEKKWDYTYEPGQEEVLRELLPRFVEVQLYQAILESIASEHSARMVAMRNATDNAKDLTRDLTLSYNKTLQANIT